MMFAACEPSTPDQRVAVAASAAPSAAEEPSPDLESARASTQEADPPPLRDDGTLFAESELMGTRMSINVFVGPERDPARGAQAIRDAFAELSRIESIASEWDPSTPLSTLNKLAGGDPVVVPPELIEILQRAKEVAEATNGRFDPTVYAVGELWSFERDSAPPSPQAIEARLPLVDWQGIELDAGGQTARLARPGMRIGLGGIAKGYGVDAASKVLSAAGFPDHIVEGGGDTYAAGSKGDEPWRIGVQRPHAAGALGAVEARNEAIVTSGNYARYFEHEGVRYTHILDPTTGWPIPAERSPASVTCRAGDATTADAYCTALSVMGTTRAIALAERTPGLDVLIIGADETQTTSSGFAERFIAFDDAPPVP
jgi:thiamine biosynthesis lipoprotein